MHRCFSAVGAIGIVLGVIFTTACVAQEAPAGAEPAAASAIGSAAEIATGTAPSDGSGEDASHSRPTVDREQTIYVPYGKLPEVFEKEGRGVFIPYERFRSLWDAARRWSELQQPDGPAGSPPPLAATIASIESHAEVGNAVVRVTADLTIELLARGWLEVPLRLQGCAIESAALGSEPARLIEHGKEGYALLIYHDSEAPQTVRLRVQYAKAFEKTPGRNRVSLTPPKSPVNRWTVRVPQPDVQIDVTPMVAMSRSVPTAEERPPEPPVSEVRALVGAADTVVLSWTAQREGAIDMEALVTADATHRLLISDGILRTRSTVHFDVARAKVSQLTLEVPVGHKIVNVYDPNIRKWSVVSDGNIQRVHIDLFEPVLGRQTLQLELEFFFDASAGSAELIVPQVTALGAVRQQGQLLVSTAPNLRAEPVSRTGLIQTDVADQPETATPAESVQAYRYAAVPYALTLRIEKLEPRIRVRQWTELFVEPQQVRALLSIALRIEDAGIFELPLSLPAGWKVTGVRGAEFAGGRAAEVKNFYVTPSDDGQRLLVALHRKAEGELGIAVEMESAADATIDLTAAENTAEIDFAIPRVEAAGVFQVEGWALVYAPESLRITAGEMVSVRQLSVGEALAELGTGQRSGGASLRPALAVGHTGRPATLQLHAQRRNPYITVRQLLMVDVQPGVVRFTNQLHYEIQYSSLDALRVDIPEAIVPFIQNRSSAIHESPIEPPPEDLADGYVAWEMRGESELIGDPTLVFTWQIPLPNLEIGAQQRIELPRIDPHGVDRLSGQILIQRAETLDAIPAAEASGLRQIDPARDVWPEAARFPAARAMEFYGPWELPLELTRYDLEDVKRTSVERAVATVVATRSGQLSYQMLYRLRSARQRLALRLPQGAQFDAQPVRLDGAAVELQKGEQGNFYIPLNNRDPDAAFLVELRFLLEAPADRIALPVFPEEPAVQQVYLAFYLPEEWRPIHFDGPWTPEFTWRRGANLALRPSPTRSQHQLIRWLTGSMKNKSIAEFPTDGVMYLFSALRPAPPPDGELRLKIVNGYAWNGVWFAAVILFGMALMRTRWATRMAAIVALLGLLVASGLVTPLLAAQWFDLPPVMGLVFVGLAWSVQAVFAVGRAVRRWRPPPVDADLVPASPAMAADASDHASTPEPEPESEPEPDAALEQRDHASDTDPHVDREADDQGGQP